MSLSEADVAGDITDATVYERCNCSLSQCVQILQCVAIRNKLLDTNACDDKIVIAAVSF